MTGLTKALTGFAALAAIAFATAGPLQAESDVAKNASALKVAAAEPVKSERSSADVVPKVDRETFGEWEVECFEPKINGLNCQIVQKLVSKETNQLVLVVSVAHDPKSDKNLLQMALPLNFLLKPGVEIAIGEAKTVVQVDRCSAQGCFVEGIAGDDLVDAFVKGKNADVKFLANAEKRLVIPFSLTGFTKAYKKMKSRNAG